MESSATSQKDEEQSRWKYNGSLEKEFCSKSPQHRRLLRRQWITTISLLIFPSTFAYSYIQSPRKERAWQTPLSMPPILRQYRKNLYIRHSKDLCHRHLFCSAANNEKNDTHLLHDKSNHSFKRSFLPKSTVFISRDLVKILTGTNVDIGHDDDVDTTLSSPENDRRRTTSWLSQTLWVLTHLRPTVQLGMALVLYLFHTLVLTQHCIVFPFQLLPNNRGYFTSIGWDSIVGIVTLVAYQMYRRHQPQQEQQQDQEEQNAINQTPESSTSELQINDRLNAKRMSNHFTAPTLPSLFSTPRADECPWKDVWQSYYAPFTSLLTFLSLIWAYKNTGIVSLWWEDRLYECARFFPITTAMHRSLSVLMGHVSWMAMGAFILRWVPRPQPFFPGQQQRGNGTSKWFQSNFFSTQWLWWVMGGYFVSAWLVNVTDVINTYVLPLELLEAVENTSVVSRLVNPEGQDWLASIVGYVAPCVTAPWWEEILYRAFLLPTLVLQLGGYKRAIFISGILFSVHHASMPAFLPLCVLGWIWAILYTKSRNLWTTIVIHSMWNSRIFLGSWLGV
ncbi:CAAX protease self-immunity-domain containing protein [Nitzschia inconspicua]|uniref:CAAX protease self-immunity-domain containing protein n=1 Tax=Nitzschia inconspicua TaxID=303405 RepID=A0A9K3KFQ3_9STRA|nr:CAAX protease self-immunity-domain containing protein [Nitzschia inconspicua]